MVHGTITCYQKGCRCAECRTSHRLYMREYRARKAMGTYNFRSLARGTDATELENTLAKVGEDFTSFSTIVRSLAVMSA